MTARSFRPAARALISIFMLVALAWAQHEMQRHLLQHDTARLQRHHEQGLQNPTSDLPCIECSLLAGATHAVAGSESPLAVSAAGFVRIAVSFVSRTVAASCFYLSRAPPLLL
ncbi:MAG: hypothetical protein M3023_03030 [Pseudomonadota bacterium]|nr:hypothetical protein [Pseudomonadota bacterium]